MPVLDSPSTASSVSTLNKLYYFARIAEAVPLSDLGTIVEFGGGYGLMCHVLEELVEPRPTYVVVDLPELLALQCVFLRAGSTLRVAPHTAMPLRLRPEAVNLVPVQFVAHGDLRCDFFLSTFALSETPRSVRRLIADDCEFFGASSLYMTGQNTDDDLWRQYSLDEMTDVKWTVRRLYDSVRIEPFPVVSAWELVATRRRG